jgi:Zn-dependent protease
MRPLIQFATIRRVPILVHWSVPAICIFLLGAGLPRIWMVAAGLGAYLSILVVHELGHHFVAVRRGYHVDRIEVFPLHAFCHLERPESSRDRALIAWGGPIAQLLLALPFTAFILAFGFTSFQTVNAVLAILGYLNPLIAIVNLTPIAPLDGSLAWKLDLLNMLRRRRKPKREKTALEAFEDAREKAIRRNRKG